MSLIRGPFSLKWGDNVITDVEEIDVEHEIDSEDYDTLQGRRLQLDGVYFVSAIVTLLASDIPALAALLPQHFVENGGVLSTGETVSNAQGAVDLVPGGCDESIVYNNLDIISCGNPAQVTRLNNVRTKFEAIEVDNKLQKVMVKFIGEAPYGEATMQFFRQGTIAVVS